MKQNQNEYIFLETTLNPRLSTPGQLIYFKHIGVGGGGVLNRDRGLI